MLLVVAEEAGEPEELVWLVLPVVLVLLVEEKVVRSATYESTIVDTIEIVVKAKPGLLEFV